jgi:hypothetical protein
MIISATDNLPRSHHAYIRSCSSAFALQMKGLYAT